MKSRLASVCLSLLSTCRALPPPTASAPPPTLPSDAATPADAPVHDTAPAVLPSPDGPPPEGAPAEGSPDALIARIRALAEGTEPLTAAVDGARGLVIVRALEAPPSGLGGERRSTLRLCGAALTRSAASVRRDLTAALEQAARGDGFACAPSLVCVARGMEHQPDWRVIFERVQGALVWTGLAQVSVAAVHPERVAAVDGYVTRALDDARRRPCRPDGR